MRVLFIHTYYIQRGGEDQSFEFESSLLEQNGHTVYLYIKNNSEIKNYSKLKAALVTVWNKETYREVRAIIKSFAPDIIHINNLFPLISTSVLFAANRHRTPVVMNLRNFRIFCLNGLFLRNGQVCELCIRKIPFYGIHYNCYRNDKLASIVVAIMLIFNRFLGTWDKKVATYIALTNFAKNKFIQGGLPPEKIEVKSNFISPDPGIKEAAIYSLFVGRLSEEKGIETLLFAWKKFPTIPLKIVGTGPLFEKIQNLIKSSDLQHVELLGYKESNEVVRLIQKAFLLINPTICYEGMPRTILEAFACGVPVVASRIGAVEEMIEDKKTGLLFAPGDIEDLSKVIDWAIKNKEELRTIRRNVRIVFKKKYTATSNYNQLMRIYKNTIDQVNNDH